MFTIDLKGANDAIDTLTGMIIPWRRKYAERKAKLDIAERQAMIHKLNAETLSENAKTERKRAETLIDKSQSELILAQAKKTEAEADLISAQARKIDIEVEKEKQALHRKNVELTFEIIKKYHPEIGEIELLDHFYKMYPIVENLVTSEIDPLILPNSE